MLKRCTSGVKLLIRKLRAFRNPLVQEIFSSTKMYIWTTHDILIYKYSFLEFSMAVLPPLRTMRRKSLAQRLHRDKTNLIANSLASRNE